MGKKTIKKELAVLGPNGTFKGEVVIKFNDRSETKESESRITHDLQRVTHHYHRIEAWANGELVQNFEFENQIEAYYQSIRFEGFANDKLKKLAHEVKPVPVMEQLANSGYK